MVVTVIAVSPVVAADEVVAAYTTKCKRHLLSRRDRLHPPTPLINPFSGVSCFITCKRWPENNSTDACFERACLIEIVSQIRFLH